MNHGTVYNFLDLFEVCKSYIIRQNDKIIDRILLILNRKKNIDIKISKHSQSLDKTKESFNILDVYKKIDVIL